MHKGLKIFFGIVFGVVFVAILSVYVFIIAPVKNFFEGSSSEPIVYVDASKSSAYQIEGEEIAYRPGSRSDRIWANILSLGTVGKPEWLYGRVIEEAELDSFEVIGANYAKDSARVYIGAKTIPEADPASFHLFGHFFAHDDHALWSQENLVMRFPDAPPTTPRSYSERLFSLDEQAYLLSGLQRDDGGLEFLPFPEIPRGEVAHYCRDWMKVNGALWFLDQRFGALKGNAKIIDCDGGIRTTYDNGVAREVTEDNYGIFITIGNSLLRARITGEQTTLAAFDEAISESVVEEYRDIVFVQLRNGDVYAVDMLGNLPNQLLGNNADGKIRDVLAQGSDAVLLGGDYYVLNERDQANELFDYKGRFERKGDYYIGESAVYYFGRPVMGLDAQDMRDVDRGLLISDQFCFDYGRYAGDIDWSRMADIEAARDHCYRIARGDYLEYMGMQIAFVEDFRLLTSKPKAGCTFCFDYAIGALQIANVTGRDLLIDKPILDGLSVMVYNGNDDYVPAEFDRPDLTENGDQYLMRAGQVLNWPIEIRSDVNDLQVNLFLSLAHSEERKQRFGEDEIRFGKTHLLLY